jgi:potassium efflux system protein
MSLADWSRSVRAVLSAPLFHLAGTTFTLGSILVFVAVVALALLFSRFLRSALRNLLVRHGWKESTGGAVTGLLHYFILVLGVLLAFRVIGVDLSALFAAGAILAVGVGFAMQNVAQSFVAGIILLAERSIKPGDILEVEGRVVRVLDMGIRSTIARTRDGEDLIIPNATLIQSTVKNYTLKDSAFRVRAKVGVVYRSDLAVVREALESVARSVSDRWGVPEPPWQVILTGFGSSSVDYEVAIWMRDPWSARLAVSELHESVWWAFRERDITIAFPQLDVHFDPPVEEGVRSLSGRVA